MLSEIHPDPLHIAEEVTRTVSQVPDREVEALGRAILGAQRVFVCGAGRSLLMMKAFAMRLMHLGIGAFVVGETITPSIGPGDLLIAGSGSGATRTTLAMMEAGRSRGAKTACLTAHPDSPIGKVSDLIVEIPARIVGIPGPTVSTQPPSSLFEQCLLIMGDSLILWLMDKLGTTYDQIRARHTKLE
jgi:6-phospho-3-hexuloisomerase